VTTDVYFFLNNLIIQEAANFWDMMKLRREYLSLFPKRYIHFCAIEKDAVKVWNLLGNVVTILNLTPLAAMHQLYVSVL
jgi:hypothetical protein